MEECVLLDRTTRPDGYGGFVTVYVEGAPFKASIVFDTSIQARRAQKEGVTSLYTVTTARNIVLEFHMVFKRIRDGKIFRVTSDGDDRATPKSTALDIRQVTAEEWSLENG
jgi:hypothetical protein